MASHELIDAQFDRAVQIVQSLPKTGPIQTDYEEKLEMYSLYKQATVGNVKSPRPGIFDMLGRAKWDAWAKHSDLDPFEAKWLYVEALLKVLRKYSDKTIARDLVREIESYGGDPSNIVLSGSFARSSASERTGSTASDEDQGEVAPQYDTARNVRRASHDGEGSGSEEAEIEEDETRELPTHRHPGHYDNRPQSSLSSHRYRTPMAGSLLTSPPPGGDLQTQPHPGFETPSAFAPPLSGYPNLNPYPVAGYSSHHLDTLRAKPSSPYNARPPSIMSRGQYAHDRHGTRPTLENAIENVQSHLAGLTERIESLENRILAPLQTSRSPRGGKSPGWFANRGTPPEDPDAPRWDINDLGLWSVVLNPLSRGIDRVCDWATFFSRDDNRSPAKMIVRRLVLDVSFLFFVVAIVGAMWRKSGVRRREVRAALVVLWRALIGSSSRKVMAEQLV